MSWFPGASATPRGLVLGLASGCCCPTASRPDRRDAPVLGPRRRDGAQHFRAAWPERGNAGGGRTGTARSSCPGTWGRLAGPGSVRAFTVWPDRSVRTFTADWPSVSSPGTGPGTFTGASHTVGRWEAVDAQEPKQRSGNLKTQSNRFRLRVDKQLISYFFHEISYFLFLLN